MNRLYNIDHDEKNANHCNVNIMYIPTDDMERISILKGEFTFNCEIEWKSFMYKKKEKK